MERGKVDQALVGVLDLDPVLGDLVDRPREGARLAVDLARGLGERRGRNAAAVAADPAFELLLAGQRLDVCAAVGDHALDERTHLGERRIRLLGCEVAHRCNPMRGMELEAATIDAFGTLITLADPVEALRNALAAREVKRTEEEVRRAFEAEVAYYVPRSHEGRDDASLAVLRRDCARVFLEAARAELDDREFTAAFLGSLVFAELPGAASACRSLSAAGLRLAVVSNWDIGLHDHLARLGLDNLADVVVTSAEAGAPKPASAVFELALARLDVPASRAVHIGDAATDEEGARAAGMRFEHAPLADAARRILA